MSSRDIRDERIWEEVQKKTFIKWINAQLVPRFGIECQIKSIPQDLQDGVILMKLIHVLYDIPIPSAVNRRPSMRVHNLDNVSLALKMLHDAKPSFELHFVKPISIVDGDNRIILGTIWLLILDSLLMKVARSQKDTELQVATAKTINLVAGNVLLEWVKRKTAGYRNVNVQNFTNSFQDGLAFCALIHALRPDLIDFNTLKKENQVENLDKAFSIAEKYMGIPRLLDIADVINNPDQHCIMTYVAQFFHYACEHSNEDERTIALEIHKHLVPFYSIKDDDDETDLLYSRVEDLPHPKAYSVSFQNTSPSPSSSPTTPLTPPAPTPVVENSLPKDWKEYFDTTYNRPYFANSMTGITTWDDPRRPPAPSVSPSTSPVVVSSSPPNGMYAQPQIIHANSQPALGYPYPGMTNFGGSQPQMFKQVVTVTKTTYYPTGTGPSPPIAVPGRKISGSSNINGSPPAGNIMAVISCPKCNTQNTVPIGEKAKKFKCTKCAKKIETEIILKNGVPTYVDSKKRHSVF